MQVKLLIALCVLFLNACDKGENMTGWDLTSEELVVVATNVIDEEALEFGDGVTQILEGDRYVFSDGKVYEAIRYLRVSESLSSGRYAGMMSSVLVDEYPEPRFYVDKVDPEQTPCVYYVMDNLTAYAGLANPNYHFIHLGSTVIYFEDGRRTYLHLYGTEDSGYTFKFFDLDSSQYILELTQDELTQKYPNLIITHDYVYRPDYNEETWFSTVGGRFSHHLDAVKKALQIESGTTGVLLEYFNLVSVVNSKRPFDDKGYTRATRLHDLSYDIHSPVEYKMIALGDVVGNLVRVTIGDNVTEYSITLVNHGDTIFHYIKDEEGDLVSESRNFRVEVFNQEGDASIGTIGVSREPKKFPISDFKMTWRLQDKSPYQVKPGGYIDYIEGIALFKVDIDVFDEVANLKSTLNVIKHFKKKRAAFDIGDSYLEEHALSNVSYIVGRIPDSIISTNAKNDRLSEEISGRITIEEAS